MRIETARNCRRCFLLLATALVAIGLAGCERRIDAGPLADQNEVDRLRKELLKGSGEPKGPTEPAVALKETGWATLTGNFKVSGTPPAPKKKNIDKDPDVCGKYPLVDESLTVDSKNGLGDVLLYVRTAGVPVNEEYAKTADAKVVLDNRDCRFEPHVLVLRTSQTLRLVNSDKLAHNSKIGLKENPEINTLVPPEGIEKKLPLSEAGPVQFGCSVHGWMAGWILVWGNPYAVKSDKQGNFTLDNLPAGIDLEFQLWHEKGKSLKDVKVAGGTVKIDTVKIDDRGRFKLRLDPDKSERLEFEVPLGALQ